VLNKVALSVQANMKTDLREIYGAPTRAAAEAAIDVFADKYGAKYEKAVACLTKDREALLAFFDFPAEHWSTGTTCARQTRSRAYSRLCVIEPYGQREPCRGRPPNS
jgi:transposase-like protein